MSAIDLKLTELEHLLKNATLDAPTIILFRKRIEDVLSKQDAYIKDIEAYQSLDAQTDLSEGERLDQLMHLLSEHPVDTEMIMEKGKNKFASRIVIIIIAVLMIAIGFTMIVLPAPQDFEMFTIYYFSPDDGVTLMDLISLLIVFGGVFLLINNNMKNK